MDLTLTLTGKKPLLLHNGRLANPIDPHTRAISRISKKRNKTDEDLVEVMQLEARGGAYETEGDGFLGFPQVAIWRCIYDAAKAYKLGVRVKQALMAEDVILPLLIGGEPVKVDAFLSEPENIDYRSVKVTTSRVMRARPIVRGWSCTARFDLFEDVIDPRDLVPVFERAGRLIGIGDWRPTYGTFEIEVA